MRKSVLYTLLLSVIFIFAGCGMGNESDTGGTKGIAPSNETGSSLSFSIVSPEDGSTVEGGQVSVKIDIQNLELVDFKENTTNVEGQGHVHVWLDQDTSNPLIASKLIEGDTLTFNDVPAGEHTLTVQLVNNDHTPIQPEVKQEIHFTTEGSDASGSTSPSTGEDSSNSNYNNDY